MLCRSTSSSLQAEPYRRKLKEWEEASAGGNHASAGVPRSVALNYTPIGKRYLQDILETMGTYVDSLKWR